MTDLVDALTGEPLVPLAPTTLERLREAGVPNIVTQLFERGLRDTVMQGVLPLGEPPKPMAGEAFTLRTIPMRADIGTADFMRRLPRNLQREAMLRVAPGQVLVADARGDMRAGIMGDIVATSLAVRGVSGIVTDGGLRDSRAIAELDIPAYCAGPSPAGSQAHLHVVDLQVPIACGGRPVFPGDVIVGDGEGVVVVPRALADEIAEAAAEQAALEAWCKARIAEGAPLVGTFPPNAETRAAYEAERRRG
jgi:regulator of RNase E activity RraA